MTKISRRQFVGGLAASTGVIAGLKNSKEAQAFMIGGAPTNHKVWRGVGQSCRGLNSQGFFGSTAWSLYCRYPMRTIVPFRYCRAVIANFNQTTSSLTDTAFAAGFNYQVGMENVYTLSYTGLPARQGFTWDAANGLPANTGSTTLNVPGGTGYLSVSDVMDCGQLIGGGLNNPFGIHLTEENQLGSSSPSNSLPYSKNITNYTAGRYLGFQPTTTSLIGSNAALNATSVNACTAVESGTSGGLTLAMLLIYVDPWLPFWLVQGDCRVFGNNEGNFGSNAFIGPGSVYYGDGVGNANCNFGFAERSAYEKAGVDMVNFGVGSDALRNTTTSSNWIMRQSAAIICNPSRIDMDLSHNDLANGQTLSQLKTNWTSTGNIFHSINPGVPLIQYLAAPTTDSAPPYPAGGDYWATVGNQADPHTTTNFTGGANSVRGLFNAAAIAKTLGNDGYRDPTVFQETGVNTNRYQTVVTSSYPGGQPYGLTNDGVHLNSYGASLSTSYAWQL